MTIRENIYCFVFYIVMYCHIVSIIQLVYCHVLSFHMQYCNQYCRHNCSNGSSSLKIMGEDGLVSAAIISVVLLGMDSVAISISAMQDIPSFTTLPV